MVSAVRFRAPPPANAGVGSDRVVVRTQAMYKRRKGDPDPCEPWAAPTSPSGPYHDLLLLLFRDTMFPLTVGKSTSIALSRHRSGGRSLARSCACGPVSYTHLTLPTNREV